MNNSDIIRKYISKNNMTQIEFANRAGISRVTVRNIITRNIIRVDTLAKIMKNLPGEFKASDFEISYPGTSMTKRFVE